MALPDPHPGLVIHCSYLWAREHAQGREEGIKNRPCAIVLTRQVIEGRSLITVLPITHSPPDRPEEAIAIPPAIKRLLGLDSQAAWIELSEVNDFIWPGPDLTPIPNSDPVRFDYGVLPPGFFRSVRDKLMQALTARRAVVVPRSQ